MPSQNALVILAEFSESGLLAPGLAGDLIRPGEARRLGTAMLRDCVEKAIHCAGFDPLVAYFPPERRGEVEDAIGNRHLWAEPSSGATAGERAEGFLRHLLADRTYRRAVALLPAFPHVDRKAIFEAAHASADTGFAFGASQLGRVGLLAVGPQVPGGLGAALSGVEPASLLRDAATRAGLATRTVALPDPIATADDLAQAVFDLRAAMATGTTSGDDVPLNTLEAFESLGLIALLRGDGSVELRRAGPPQRRAR